MFGGSCDDVEVLDAGAQGYQVDSLALSKMPMTGYVEGVVARKVQPASSYIHKTCIHTKVHFLYSFLKVSDYWLRILLPPHPKKLPEIYFSDTLLRYHTDRQVSDPPATLPYM